MTTFKLLKASKILDLRVREKEKQKTNILTGLREKRVREKKKLFLSKNLFII